MRSQKYISILVLFLTMILPLFWLMYFLEPKMSEGFKEGLLTDVENKNLTKIMEEHDKLMEEICKDTIIDLKKLLDAMKDSDSKLKIYNVLNKNEVGNKKAVDTIDEIAGIIVSEKITDKKITGIMDTNEAKRVLKTKKSLEEIRDLNISSDVMLNTLINNQIRSPIYRGEKSSMNLIKRHISDMDELMQPKKIEISDEKKKEIQQAKSGLM